MKRLLLTLPFLFSLSLSANQFYHQLTFADSSEETGLLDAGDNNTFAEVTDARGFLNGAVTDITAKHSEPLSSCAYASTSMSENNRKRKALEQAIQNNTLNAPGFLDISLKVGGLAFYADRATLKPSEPIVFKSVSEKDQFILVTVEDCAFSGSLNLLKIELKRFFTARTPNVCPRFISQSSIEENEVSGFAGTDAVRIHPQFNEWIKKTVIDKNLTELTYTFLLNYSAENHRFSLRCYNTTCPHFVEFEEEITMQLVEYVPGQIQFYSPTKKAIYITLNLNNDFNPEIDLDQTIFTYETVLH